MKVTLILKDELVKKAMEVTNVKEITALVHMGLEVLIEKKRRERLVALGGLEKQLINIPRRRV